jgi:uncharacterized membrane protein
MTEATEGRPEAGRELDRIVFFSDAVFAIAITILVLDIRVPDGLSPAELPAEVLGLWPKYLSYVVSFLVLAIYWQAHHRVFRPIRGYDGTLVWLNFLFLMAVAFLPFPTSLLGEYGREQVSVVIYAANARWRACSCRRSPGTPGGATDWCLPTTTTRRARSGGCRAWRCRRCSSPP